MTEEEVTALNYRTVYKKRKTVIDDYMNIIYKMLSDRIEPAVIISYVFMIGYTGKIDTLRIKIERIAKNNFNMKLKKNWAYKFDYPKDILAIKRNEILRHITIRKPKIKRNETIDKHMDIIKNEYPVIAELEKLYNDFHETLMGNEANRLKIFINKYVTSIGKGFIASIKEDINPVLNAISFDINSGFVEGNNNKFKLIKRILYGRASLSTLFKKCYLAFKFDLDDFTIPHFS